MEIAGHTDAQGGEGSNLALSQARAEAVLLGLQGRRVLVGSLTAMGYGEARPIADNDTEEGREANRRIEFTLTGAGATPTANLSPQPDATTQDTAASDPAAIASAPGAGDPAAIDQTAPTRLARTRPPRTRPARPTISPPPAPATPARPTTSVPMMQPPPRPIPTPSTRPPPTPASHPA